MKPLYVENTESSCQVTTVMKGQTLDHWMDNFAFIEMIIPCTM